LSGKWNREVDDLGDGDGEINDLEWTVAFPGNMRVVWARRNGDGLGLSNDGGGRGSEGESEGVGASAWGDELGRDR
jgi:hypothetical protein